MELTKRFNEDLISELSNYIAEGGKSSGIILTPKQESVLEALRFADEKIRESNGKLKREQIANMIKAKFECCRDTAFKYIVYAERIFSSSFPLNKKYEIQQRIELLKSKINACYIKNDFFNAGQLEKILQKYYEVYPDLNPIKTPKNIFFIIGEKIHTPEMKYEDAILVADEIATELEKKEDY